jgi:hypothetical protein
MTFDSSRLGTQLLDDDREPLGSRDKDGPRVLASGGRWQQWWWITYNGTRAHWLETFPTNRGESQWEEPQGG